MLRIAAIYSLVFVGALAACSAGPSPASVSAPAAALPQSNAPASTSAGGAGAVPVAAALDRMIVRQGNLNVTVKDLLAGVQGITSVAERAAGYVASTDYRNEGDQQTATMSIRVPSQSYDNVVRDIRGLSLKVNQETTTSQDVTQQFADLSAQLHNLQVTETQYLTLMTKAQTVDDIIKVQQKLTEVQGEIEKIQGQINYIQRKSDFSQIDITMIPEAQQALDPKLQSPFVNAVRSGWEGSIEALTVIVTVIVFLWWLIPMAAIGYAIAWFIRRRFPRPKAPIKAPDIS